MCLAAWCDSAFGVAFILSNILSLGSGMMSQLARRGQLPGGGAGAGVMS